MEQTLELDLPLLLPDVPDERDRCVDKLRERLAGIRGILKAHVHPADGQAVLCLHFDPNLLNLAQVDRLARQAGVDIRERFRHETLRLGGMDCADCALSIEHIVGRRAGVLHVSVNYPLEIMEVGFDTEKLKRGDLVQLVRALGYDVVEEKAEAEAEGWFAQFEDLLLPIIAGVFLAFGYFLAGTIGLSAWPFYAVAYVAGGWDLARHGIRAALRGRFDIEFLMLVAAVGAAAVGEPAEGGLLLFLFSLGHALEHYATGRARRAVESLGKLTPRVARVRRDGSEREVPVAELRKGDQVVVRPAERVPADGTIREGSSALDESPITGESVPVEKEQGADVFAGSLNGDGGLVIEVTRPAADSTMARVIKMVEEAQTQRSPTQRFSEQFTRVFVPVTLILVALTIVGPPLLGLLSWSEAFLRAMAVLVGASPCALALATPAAVLSGIARAARSGVLIKGGMHLENLGSINAIAFDKTGTLTLGTPEVTDIVTHAGFDERELVRLAAAVEEQSTHPLARAVVQKAKEFELELPAVSDLKAAKGCGLCACIDDKLIHIGNRKLFEQEGRTIPPELASAAAKLEDRARTIMIVAYGDTFLGVLGLADRPRDDARATLERLRKLGVRQLVMLTGDNERVASAVAADVGIDSVQAHLMPEDKLTAVKELQAKHGRVAMVGDGVNDAPALALATVGIAMGAGGTDVALESADVALMSDDLGKLPFALSLSMQSRRVIRQNLLVSLGVVAMLVPAGLLGVASIGYAILFHEGSTMLVVLNALRLLRYRG